MNVSLRILRACTGAALAALIAGCAGVPVAAPRAAVSASTIAQLRARGIADVLPHLLAAPAPGRSWMSPDAKKRTLLYVADEATDDVDVYSYPGGKPMGTLSGFDTPAGLCSNKAGDVFVLNGAGSTVEVFAHGATTPLRTLDLPGYPELNCTVDPTTGNFAVGVLDGSCGSCVAIFANAQGKPVTIAPSGQESMPGCGYDDAGNLFCAARTVKSGKFELIELPAGESSFVTIPVGGGSGISSGPVQWDGKDVAMAAGAEGTIYQIAISGSSGTITGSTALNGTGWVWQFWLASAKRIIAPTYGGSNAEVGYWNYPAGGDPTKTITGFSQPDGATLSTAKK